MPGERDPHQSQKGGARSGVRFLTLRRFLPLRIFSSWRRFGMIWPHDILIADGWSHFWNQGQMWVRREVEMRRPFLCVPLGMIVGVLLYVQADQEPSFVAPLLLSAITALLAWLNRTERRAVMMVMLALCAISVGFLAGCVQTLRLSAPILHAPWTGYATVVVEQVDWGQGPLVQDAQQSGPLESDTSSASIAHLIVRVLRMPPLAPDQRPYKLKLTLKGQRGVQASDILYAAMRVQPLPGPTYPGGYDFRFDYFFKQIGGVGSIVGPIKAGYGRAPTSMQRFWNGIDHFRCSVTERIRQVIGGQNGAVAAALITGKRGYINDHSNDILRAAGIYHVVSISGLHMAIAAGFTFACARLFLVLIPGLALRYDVRRTAAWAGMAGAVIYDVFAGSDIATERSMLMTLVLFGAIAFGRRLLSMRNCALAAILLILVEPSGVLNPGFQMSFAAVAGLIAFYERKPKDIHATTASYNPAPLHSIEEPQARFHYWARFEGVFKDVMLTTLVAEAATAPFGLFHFHMMQSYGLIGNAITLPFVSFIVMPAAGLGLIAMPFGLDAPIWSVMGYGIDAMMRCCEWIATWPAATRYVSGFSHFALLMMVGGFLCLCVLISPLRFGFIVLIGMGMGMAVQAPRPEFYVGRDGRFIAVRQADGRLLFAGLGLNGFTLTQILRQDGDERSVQDQRLIAHALCEKKQCRLQTVGGHKIELVWDPSLIAQACDRADLVVTRLDYRGPCRAPLIDGQKLQRQGAFQGWIKDGHLVLQADHSPLRHRPWSPSPINDLH